MCVLVNEAQCLLSFDISLPILSISLYFPPSIVLSLCLPAPTGFTGTQAPTGAVGAPEEDRAAASRAGAGEAAAGKQTPTAQKQGEGTGE